jgi:hypothetical protein
MGAAGDMTGGWLTVGGLASTDEILASGQDIINTSKYADAFFLIAVRDTSGTPTLHLQTAPVNDEEFWVDMTSVAITSTASQTAKVLFATAGTPMASLIRYKITAAGANWRLTCKVGVALKNV